MGDGYHYRLSKDQKQEIAHNLIGILETDQSITKETKRFIGDWILTDSKEKRKAFYDVWDIVLKNFLPTTRPILFRACDRISKNGKIASFTGRLECAKRFSKGKGSLIICDTKESMAFEETFHKVGEYKHTFYPLVDVLVKEKILSDHVGEDEYIMRINLGRMGCVKWINND